MLRQTAVSRPVARPRESSLSQSDLWRLQREYFEREGIDAWRGNVVPSYVTTNPFIAETYAELVLAWLRDLPGGDPVHIIELGAGSGRFAHSFLRHFFSRHSGPREVSYVMTDISAANVSFWRDHERLQPFVNEGQLDFAFFDAGRSKDLTLLSSGRRLSPGACGPLAAIANYVFDTIEHDLFEVKNGQLHECRVSLSGDETAHDVQLTWSLSPCDGDVYEDAGWNDVLKEHQGLNDTAFLFPVGAFRCVEQLRALASGELMLLVGDKGQTTLEALRGREKPDPTRHGSLSLGVNFHALSSHVRALGGDVLQTPHPAASLTVIAYLFGQPAHHCAAVRVAFEDKVTRFGPDDFFMLKKAAPRTALGATLTQLLALLRLSRWDQAILNECYPQLLESIPGATEADKRGLRETARRVWAGYFPLGEEEDLAFNLGNLMAALGEYAEAVEYLETSLELYGDDETVRSNIQVCEEMSRHAR